GPAGPGGGGGGIPGLGDGFVGGGEKTDYADVIGTGAMPYLDSLVGAYGLATQYYADTHPSIGNYFMMTVGDVITHDDSDAQTVAGDNIVRHRGAAGKTWKAYAEDLPSAGDVTLDLDNGSYASR